MIGGSVTRESHMDVGEWLGRVQATLLEELATHAAIEAMDSLDHPGPQAPSLPDEPPNSQTGALWEGIDTEVHGDHSLVISRRNGSDLVPLTLEGGTEDGRLAARPYMGPAFHRTVGALNEIVATVREREQH